jgi:hypothetical protein
VQKAGRDAPGVDGPEMIDARTTLHIGMMKAASTTLQGIWKNSPGIDLIHSALPPWMAAFRQTPRPQRKAALDAIIQGSVSGAPSVVVSHESLSGLNWQQLAVHFSELSGDLRILFVTRNPWDYVQNLYNKNLRHGYAGTIRDFVHARRNPRRRTFDFDQLRRVFADAAGIETILSPFELIKTDPVRFYDRISEVVGKPVKPGASATHRNPTPVPEALMALSAMNRLAKTILTPAAKQEYDTLLYPGPELLGRMSALDFAARER